MLKKKQDTQSKLEMVAIDQLVPKDHLLRKIDGAIDFSFIHDKVAPLYCADNGRPALDPALQFKMLFIGYLFGVRSERRLVKEIEVNVAYRWFLGLGLMDKVPDASTFSQNRRRRFNEHPEIYQSIFDEIVLQAVKRKLVSGKVLYTDSTHIKANANKHKAIKAQVEKSRAAYLDDLERAVNADREAHGKKPLRPRESKPEVKTIKRSTTDPDSGFMTRDGKPRGFFYLEHRTVDGRANIIVDSFVTPGNVHDSTPYLDRLDDVRERFGFDVEAVGLDAGYFTAPLCKGLEDREIAGVIAYGRPPHKKGYLYKKDFHYNETLDAYFCPRGHKLSYSTTNREGYREYKSKSRICRNCPLLDRCTKSKNHVKVLTRHVWEAARERVRERRLTEQGKAIYVRRKETVERSFADGKELHGLRYARMRGRDRVSEQSLLSAACQNMKKIALAVFLCVFGRESGSLYALKRFRKPPGAFSPLAPRIPAAA